MLLDTDSLIDLERKHPAADAWLKTLPFLPFAAGFAAMELLNGCQNRAARRKVETFLLPFPLVWPTEADMQRAFREFGALKLSHNLGLIDAVIAATAVGQGVPLVTFNVRHFRAVPGLVTVQPYVR